MLFNTSIFFIFLLITFVFYWFSAKYNNKLSKSVLLTASYIFYGWWDWRFLILIVISSLTDFVIGKYLFRSPKKSTRKLLLAASLLVNIGILFFFKYFNFFIDSFQAVSGIDINKSWSTLNIILPVGISFYTFQTLSYTIDIYRNRITPTRSLLTFFTFVAFFPQLVAGPIERAGRLIPQFEKRPTFEYTQATSGLKLMLWGFFKKMVIADQLAKIVNAVYAQPDQFGSLGIVFATLLFGYQIYCDFSGYSDIAIGTARLFGIELMTNFKTPYLATSFREFWHRWHISLSTWFRDYVYIPLGGNRGNSVFWMRNIFITFVVSGLWHGANITFLIWGALHGLFLIIEHFISKGIKINRKLKSRLGWIITFLLVNMSWIFFRAESWQHIKKLAIGIAFNHKSGNFTSFLIKEGHFSDAGRMLLLIFPVFILIEFLMKEKSFDEFLSGFSRPLQWGIFYLIIVVILFFGVLNAAPQFIYFQF
ncbi:MBOAT family O-acyltransferase [Maribellus sediminis]|uniref:MBOAT family O-acyltransferase n=1 Tax=Maribellus sediminis TaxID=2696285 RepID=UPI0014320172|nr:MBOAT family O-acyltransferase [Maribellus sediminis]